MGINIDVTRACTGAAKEVCVCVWRGGGGGGGGGDGKTILEVLLISLPFSPQGPLC